MSRSAWRILVAVAACVASALGAEQPNRSCPPVELAIRVAFGSPQQLADGLKELAEQRGSSSKWRLIEARLREAGCSSVESQAGRNLSEPNLVCRIGDGSRPTIVVGLSPWLDGWQSAALLPQLARAISAGPRRHDFLLVAFGRNVLLQPDGARELLDQLASPPSLFVHFADVGMQPLVVGADTAESQTCLVQSVAAAMGSPISALSTWERVYYPCGEASALLCTGVRRDLDTFPFLRRSIAVTGLYGVREEPSLGLRARDPPRLSPAHYVASYRVLAAYLVAADGALGAPPRPTAPAPPES